MDERTEDFLQHYGVLGMHWGVRKREEAHQVGDRREATAKRFDNKAAARRDMATKSYTKVGAKAQIHKAKKAENTAKVLRKSASSSQKRKTAADNRTKKPFINSHGRLQQQTKAEAKARRKRTLIAAGATFVGAGLANVLVRSVVRDPKVRLGATFATQILQGASVGAGVGTGIAAAVDKAFDKKLD